MFEVNNNIAKIDGSKGKYDSKVTDPSTRYGRNAVDNYYSYVEKPLVTDSMNPAPILDFGLDPNAPENNANKIDKFLKENDEYLMALPPLQFEYRYMPNVQNGQIDKKALLGAAYEEMGKVKEISVKDLDASFAPDDSFSSKPLDVNNDGKIDVTEYSTSILAADMLSKSSNPNLKNIDGTINKQGLDSVLAYTSKLNSSAATNMYSKIYNTYNLGAEKNNFNPNM